MRHSRVITGGGMRPAADGGRVWLVDLMRHITPVSAGFGMGPTSVGPRFSEVTL